MLIAGRKNKHCSQPVLYCAPTIERVVPATIVVFGTLWGVTYVLSAIHASTDVDDASFFLTSFLFLLVVTGCWVVIEVIHDAVRCRYSHPAEKKIHHIVCYLKDKRLYTFVSLPVFLLLIWQCGFTIASLVFTLGLAGILGERLPHVMIIISSIALFIVWVLFSTLLVVPLPLWPA